MNSRVCHINARREGGPRWNPDQSEKDNRSEQNLVLMCLEHANTIDNPATLPAYPPERLKDWKTKQLKEYDRLNQGWALNDEMAREAIKESFSSVGIAISNSTVHLDGKGGKAPGAGGGGGGAIGLNARGGDGGSGGEIVSAMFNATELEKSSAFIAFSLRLAKVVLDHSIRARTLTMEGTLQLN